MKNYIDKLKKIRSYKDGIQEGRRQVLSEEIIRLKKQIEDLKNA